MPPSRPHPNDLAVRCRHGDLRRSLMEAALRAGASHNAPYNRFADKRNLLAVLAAAGCDVLCARLLAVGAGAGAVTRLLVDSLGRRSYRQPSTKALAG